MKKKQVIDKIIQIIYNLTNIIVKKDEELKDVGIDSLILVEIIINIEEELGIEFCDNNLEPSKLTTIEKIAEEICK